MAKKKQTPSKVVAKRSHRVTFLLSEEEKQIVDSYLQKRRISNRSNWIRELVLRSISRHLDEDLPMLFTEHEMRR